MIDVTTTRTSERGFLHKRVARFGRKLARGGLRLAGATNIPILSGAARLASSFTRGGSRNRLFIGARAVQRARQRAFGRRSRQAVIPPALIPKGPGGIVGLAPGVKGGITGFAVEPGTECPKGFHKNKSGYYVKTTNEFVEPETRCVKNRRRNNSNGQAAMRAARRLLGRKKSQDQIDKALRAFAPRARGRRRLGAKAGTTIVQN